MDHHPPWVVVGRRWKGILEWCQQPLLIRAPSNSRQGGFGVSTTRLSHTRGQQKKELTFSAPLLKVQEACAAPGGVVRLGEEPEKKLRQQSAFMGSSGDTLGPRREGLSLCSINLQNKNSQKQSTYKKLSSMGGASYLSPSV